MGSLRRWSPADRQGWRRIGRRGAAWSLLVLATGDHPPAVLLALVGMGVVASLWAEALRASEARALAERRVPAEDLAPASRIYWPATEYTVDRRRLTRWRIGAEGRGLRPVAAG